MQHFGAKPSLGNSMISDSVESMYGRCSPEKTEMTSVKGPAGVDVAYAVRSTKQKMIVERISIRMVVNFYFLEEVFCLNV